MAVAVNVKVGVVLPAISEGVERPPHPFRERALLGRGVGLGGCDSVSEDSPEPYSSRFVFMTKGRDIGPDFLGPFV